MRSQTASHPPHDDLRGSVRYSTQLEVLYGLVRLERRANVTNLSEGGLFIRTNDVFKTGSRIVLALKMPAGEIHLTGEVMWAIRVPEHQTDCMEHGMGVQFLDPGPDWTRTFARWKDTAVARRSSTPRSDP